MNHDRAYGTFRTDDREYHDRKSRIGKTGEVGAPWAPRERGGYWRHYEKTRVVGKETPSKSTSSTTA